MDKVIIRKAVVDDAAEIANVHTNSWREAYKSLLPQAFLDERPLYFKNRYEMWKKVLSKDDDLTYVAESENSGIVGFSNGGMGRDEDKVKMGEVYAIYLLEAFQGRGIGFDLLKACFNSFKEKSINEAYLWVLKDNPTERFYQRTGGVKLDEIKDHVIADKAVQELCYYWNDLARI